MLQKFRLGLGRQLLSVVTALFQKIAVFYIQPCQTRNRILNDSSQNIELHKCMLNILARAWF